MPRLTDAGLSLSNVGLARRSEFRFQLQTAVRWRRPPHAGVLIPGLISPHFVFNTLNTIATLIQHQPEKAEETTVRLGRLLHLVVGIRDCPLISLDTELRILRAYLELEKLGLGDRLNCFYDVPDELLTVTIPSMLLQPLAENAVRHGIRQLQGPGYLRVRASAKAAWCQIEVADNGPGNSVEHGTGQGIRLVLDRLEQSFPSLYTFRIKRYRRTRETIVTVRFPLSHIQEVQS